MCIGFERNSHENAQEDTKRNRSVLIGNGGDRKLSVQGFLRGKIGCSGELSLSIFVLFCASLWPSSWFALGKRRIAAKMHERAQKETGVSRPYISCAPGRVRCRMFSACWEARSRPEFLFLKGLHPPAAFATTQGLDERSLHGIRLPASPERGGSRVECRA